MKNGLGWLLITFVLLSGVGTIALLRAMGTRGGISGAGSPAEVTGQPPAVVPGAVRDDQAGEPETMAGVGAEREGEPEPGAGEPEPWTLEPWEPEAEEQGGVLPAGAMHEEPGWGVAPPSGELLARASALVDQLGDPALREQARAELLALGADVIPVLMMRRDDHDFTIRWEMVNIGGLLTDPRQLPAISEQAMTDEHAHVRWRARWAITEYEDPVLAELTFLEGLESDDVNRRWNAAISLSMLRSSASLDVIHRGLTSADEWQRWEAVNALGRVGTEASIVELRAALPSLPDRARREAALVIGEIGGPLAAPALLELVSSEDPEIRWRACKSLARVADPSACGFLMQLKATETDPQVIKHLDAAIVASGC